MLACLQIFTNHIENLEMISPWPEAVHVLLADLILGVIFSHFLSFLKTGINVYRQWVPCNYSFSLIIFVNLFIGPGLAPNCLMVLLKDCFDFLVFIFVNV